ncbi:MAG: hypothetical protein OEY49_08750 [Candidatus Heimdallarchaeota archaeon]|nr:hypothetical protein [Candidatus Heimdallarchaeota archaeon]
MGKRTTILLSLGIILIILIISLNKTIDDPTNTNQTNTTSSPYTSSSSSSTVETTYPITGEINPFNVDLYYPKIAFVQPTFTKAAYSGYYSCFQNLASCMQINSSIYLRQIAPSSGWSTSNRASTFISNLISLGYPSEKLIVINDQAVHQGDIFLDNGLPAYDVIVFFHNEYITLDEYRNAMNFIKVGGNVIAMNGNGFFAEIEFNENTNYATLVSGHSVTFDGENATSARGYYRFWEALERREHFYWFGSRFYSRTRDTVSGATFRIENNNPHPVANHMNEMGISQFGLGYSFHEENTMITRNTHVIADWAISSTQDGYGVKIYEIFPEGPIGGSLIHFGVFGSTVMADDLDGVRTFITTVRHQMGVYADPWIRYPMNGAVLSGDIQIDYTKGWQTTTYLNSVNLGNIERGHNLQLIDGDYNLTIAFHGLEETHYRSVMFSIDNIPPTINFNVYGNSSNLLEGTENVGISISDLHPDEYIVWDYSSLLIDYSINREKINENFVVDEMLINLGTRSQGSRYFRVDALDAAGNVNREWYLVDIGSSSAITKIHQPVANKINSSFAKVEFYKPPIEYDIFLQVSYNEGYTWETNSMSPSTESENLVEAYIEKGSDSRLWYRIVFRYQGNVLYMPNVRSFQWDNTVFAVKNHNISSSMNGNEEIRISWYQEETIESSVYLKIYNSGTLIHEQFVGENFNQNLNEINYVLPNLLDGSYILQQLIVSSTTNYSISFPFVIGYTTPIAQYEIIRENYSSSFLGSTYQYSTDIETSFICIKIIDESCNYYSIINQPPIITLNENGTYVFDITQFDIMGMEIITRRYILFIEDENNSFLNYLIVPFTLMTTVILLKKKFKLKLL